MSGHKTLPLTLESTLCSLGRCKRFPNRAQHIKKRGEDPKEQTASCMHSHITIPPPCCKLARPTSPNPPQHSPHSCRTQGSCVRAGSESQRLSSYPALPIPPCCRSLSHIRQRSSGERGTCLPRRRRGWRGSLSTYLRRSVSSCAAAEALILHLP
ncbi:hypothetical protein VTK73DRAFT_190 [Phialemonium thermophilum]|uniref:Uncharacterized protein n=1 Tax=Phialemonium thermophilum TaxID=223376 RepID=A0ABR3XFQ5_9PEZI